MMNGQWTRWIELEALKLGFDAVGFARAERLVDDEIRLTQWLKQDYHGNMRYMENHFDKRLDPRLLVEDAQTVITFIKNYYPEQLHFQSDYKISCYAYGQDYHDVIRNQLQQLIASMQSEIGNIQARGFVDSAPVLERSWAVRSGLGWVGKNGNLISKRKGSFFFIATLITDLALDYTNNPVADFCGTCTKCIDACPTDAILPNRTINGSHCISYYTIELKDALQETNKTWDNWIFGCDICQEVCPWNRFSTPHQEDSFKPLSELVQFSNKDWEELDEATFKQVFSKSPIKRSKFSGLSRNIAFIKNQSDKLKG